MKKKILLVDDNISFSGVMNIASLSPQRYDIDRVHSGHDAVRYLLRSHYDGVLLDLVLPDMDGLDLLKQIRLQFAKDLPVVIVNDHGNASLVVEAQRYGAFNLPHTHHSAEYIMQIIDQAVEYRHTEAKTVPQHNSTDHRSPAHHTESDTRSKEMEDRKNEWHEFILNDGVMDYRQADRVFKKRYFGALLKLTGGNISKAAIKAGITRQGLHKILNSLKDES